VKAHVAGRHRPGAAIRHRDLGLHHADGLALRASVLGW